MRSITFRTSVFCLAIIMAMSVARAETPVQSTDVFTLRDNQFYLDGQPFAEMSFNKFDLMWEIWDGISTRDRTGDPTALKKAIAEQEDALRGLHEMGFRTIRIFGAPWAGNAATFAEARPTKPILEAIDTTLDLCARHDIKVVFSLGLGLFAYEYGEAAPGDAPKPISLYADPASKARADCYAYLDMIVNRYKDRKSIAMWEVSNELTNLADIGVRKDKLSPTLPQVAEFFDSTARRIHADDPLRLVSDGGSHLRESAWHLSQGLGWPKDSLEQYRQAYAAYFQHSAIDVIDNHYYDLRKGGLQLASTPDGKPVWMTPAQYVEIAQSLGKGAIIGEYGTLPSGWESRKTSAPDAGWFVGYHDPNAAKWVQKGVDDLVDARVSIAYWWAYQSDRPVDQRANPVVFGERTTPDLMKIIEEGNRRLKAEMGAPLGGK